jgi:hypothetical protein
MGGRYRIDLGGNSNNEKINKIIIYPGLRRPPINHFTCNNQQKTGAIMEESRERGKTIGERGGECKSIVLVMIEVGVL